MLCHHRRARYLATTVILVVVLAAVPLDGASRKVVAANDCTLAAEVRTTTCRLVSGETVDGVLDPSIGSATYRVDVLSPDVTLELVLATQGGRKLVSVLDWRGQPLATSTVGDGAPEARLTAKLPLPGAYAVRVSGEATPDTSSFQVTARIEPAAQSPHLFWPPPLVPGAGPLRDERQVVRTPRVGTPSTPSVHGRALGAPPDGMLSDFTFVSDVQFDQIPGPSAFTVRFRYEPEAGGGSGYLLQVDPVAGTVSLDAFAEGIRQSIVGDQPLAIVPTADSPNRLTLTATGSSIRATLDGQTILETRDGRFGRGLIVVGATTWSDPVTVTFDHIQVTTTPR